MTDRKQQALKRKLQEARFRLVSRAPELAFPLVDMRYVAVKDVFHISTNASCIYFDAAWLDKLSEWALDYALCHQLMHIRLGHLNRSRLYKGERYHYACNIIVNAHLEKYGFVEDKLPGIGELRRNTLFPVVPGDTVTPAEAYRMIPFDPSKLSVNQQAKIRIDSDLWWDRPEDRGETGIVILSPEDPLPDDLIPSEKITGAIEACQRKYKTGKKRPPSLKEESEEPGDWENFTAEYTTGPGTSLKETIQSLRRLKSSEEAEHDSAMAERVIRNVPIIPKDWRSILNHFIMDETRDYDFTPPDRRMQELDFFLPDFNESMTPRLNVLFMVDISGSLEDEEVTMAMAELNAAIEQFGGMLQGLIGFFDHKVHRVFPLQNTSNLWKLVPGKGGGTDFGCIFSYVREKMAQDLPSEIVIMTDGKADFPDYSETMGIPVLWLLTTNRVRIPWGQAAWFRE